MRRLTKLNINESENRGYLVFEESWYDVFDRLVIYFIFSWIVVLPFLVFFDPYRKDIDYDIFYIIVLAIPFLFGIYVIYRKATEKSLFKIITPYDRQKNREILLEYATTKSYELYRKSNRCLIFNEPTSAFNLEYKKSRIFLIEDNLVMYSIVQDRFKLNLPTLTSHLNLKKDLKKLFNTKSEDPKRKHASI